MRWGANLGAAIILCLAGLDITWAQTPTLANTDEAAARARRIAWFNEAKFGLFVHWGPFAVHGSDPDAAFDYFAMKENAAAREIFSQYAMAFDPKSFDAAQWIDTAKNAGMKYIIFTSKHHDGYCMFDSALTDYDSMDCAPKRDYVRELIPAARKAGLKIGFYYSMLDWRHPDYFGNLPHFVDKYLFGQVRELCTNYGPIDCLWFDGEWDHPASTWRAPELVRMIRELQPDALINDRLGKGERGLNPLCDFFTREQPSEMNVAMPFEQQRPYPWEACMTIGDYWQYSVKDTHFKSVPELLWILIDVVSRGGALLLNVGPNPDGMIPEPLVERLRGIGAWMTANGESIYGAARSPFCTLSGAKCTAKGNRVYLHLLPDAPKRLPLPGLQNDIRKVWLLADGAPLAFDNAAKTIRLPPTLPEQTVVTVAVELDGVPSVR